ncbi:MAG: hypothetical protein DWQ42_10110 [Planctomycetota bacterium]|nr:MAG: hypothetical protein DWQ42_10110 [Planctomycetota bacterium]
MALELSCIPGDPENCRVKKYADTWLCTRPFFVCSESGKTVCQEITLRTDGVVKTGTLIRAFLESKSHEISDIVGRPVTDDQLATALFLTPSNQTPLDDDKLRDALPALELVLNRLEKEPNRPLQLEEICDPLKFGLRIEN